MKKTFMILTAIATTKSCAMEMECILPKIENGYYINLMDDRPNQVEIFHHSSGESYDFEKDFSFANAALFIKDPSLHNFPQALNMFSSLIDYPNLTQEQKDEVEERIRMIYLLGLNKPIDVTSLSNEEKIRLDDKLKYINLFKLIKSNHVSLKVKLKAMYTLALKDYEREIEEYQRTKRTPKFGLAIERFQSMKDIYYQVTNKIYENTYTPHNETYSERGVEELEICDEYRDSANEYIQKMSYWHQLFEKYKTLNKVYIQEKDAPNHSEEFYQLAFDFINDKVDIFMKEKDRVAVHLYTDFYKRKIFDQKYLKSPELKTEMERARSLFLYVLNSEAFPKEVQMRAFYNLGNMERKGIGIDQPNPVIALKRFMFALKNEYTQDQIKAACAYQAGKILIGKYRANRNGANNPEYFRKATELFDSQEIQSLTTDPNQIRLKALIRKGIIYSLKKENSLAKSTFFVAEHNPQITPNLKIRVIMERAKIELAAEAISIYESVFNDPDAKEKVKIEAKQLYTQRMKTAHQGAMRRTQQQDRRPYGNNPRENKQ